MKLPRVQILFPLLQEEVQPRQNNKLLTLNIVDISTLMLEETDYRIPYIAHHQKELLSNE